MLNNEVIFAWQLHVRATHGSRVPTLRAPLRHRKHRWRSASNTSPTGVFSIPCHPREGPRWQQNTSQQSMRCAYDRRDSRRLLGKCRRRRQASSSLQTVAVRISVDWQSELPETGASPRPPSSPHLRQDGSIGERETAVTLPSKSWGARNRLGERAGPRPVRRGAQDASPASVITASPNTVPRFLLGDVAPVADRDCGGGTVAQAYTTDARSAIGCSAVDRSRKLRRPRVGAVASACLSCRHFYDQPPRSRHHLLPLWGRLRRTGGTGRQTSNASFEDPLEAPRFRAPCVQSGVARSARGRW